MTELEVEIDCFSRQSKSCPLKLNYLLVEMAFHFKSMQLTLFHLNLHYSINSLKFSTEQALDACPATFLVVKSQPLVGFKSPLRREIKQFKPKTNIDIGNGLDFLSKVDCEMGMIAKNTSIFFRARWVCKATAMALQKNPSWPTAR